MDTVAERNAIIEPLHGSLAFVDDDDDLFQYDQITDVWNLITTGGGVSTSPDVLIDGGTIATPNDNLLIDAGAI